MDEDKKIEINTETGEVTKFSTYYDRYARFGVLKGLIAAGIILGLLEIFGVI